MFALSKMTTKTSLLSAEVGKVESKYSTVSTRSPLIATRNKLEARWSLGGSDEPDRVAAGVIALPMAHASREFWYDISLADLGKCRTCY